MARQTTDSTFSHAAQLLRLCNLFTLSSEIGDKELLWTIAHKGKVITVATGYIGLDNTSVHLKSGHTFHDSHAQRLTECYKTVQRELNI